MRSSTNGDVIGNHGNFDYWAVVEGGGQAFPLDAFFVGLIFGWSVLKTKSLESAVVLHIFYNAINLIGALIRFKVL